MSPSIDDLFSTTPTKQAIEEFFLQAASVEALADACATLDPKALAKLARLVASRRSRPSTPEHRKAFSRLFAVMVETHHKAAVASALGRIHVWSLPELDGSVIDLNVSPALLSILASRPPRSSAGFLDHQKLLVPAIESLARQPDAASHLGGIRAHQQSPFFVIAKAARSALAEHGESAPPYRYAGLLPEVNGIRATMLALELERLGGFVELAPTPTAHLAYYSSARREQWQGVDPLGEISLPAGVVWNVYAGLRMDHPRFTFKDRVGSHTLTRLGGASENYDVQTDAGRHLLAVWFESTKQFYFCIDFASPDNPSVFSIDHDGTGPRRIGSLADFFKALKPAR